MTGKSWAELNVSERRTKNDLESLSGLTISISTGRALSVSLSLFAVRKKGRRSEPESLFWGEGGGVLYPFDPTLSLVKVVSVYKLGVVWTWEGGRGEETTL